MSSACEGCPAVRPEELEEGLRDWDFVVALAGNPNTGKSTVFNTLTGLRQHTGNWPGKTVTRAEGEYEHGGMRFKLVDLPGTYSLLSASTDEEIARNFILFGGPDVTVVVVDATRLERNLNLVLQILEITDQAVICLNLMDEARRNGLEIDVERLESELGVPVVPTAARYGEGMQELKDQIERVASGEISCRPRRLNSLPEGLKLALSELEAQTRRAYPHLPNPRWIALRLLDGDERINRAIERREFERRVEVAA